MDVLDTEQDVRVLLNVGGTRHETFLNTLENFPDTRLAWISEQLRKNPSRDREFFFDRHPGIFAHILNYFRTGKLHVPRDICGPMFEQELAFWGIDPKQIEHCCWAYYDEHNELEKTWGELTSAPMESLSDQEDGEMCLDEEMSRNEIESGWNHAVKKKWRGFKKRMWRVLEDPYSSKIAWVINLLSVLLSILVMLVFCLSSLPEFADKSSRSYEVAFGLETFVITFFTIELILRLVTAPTKQKLLRDKSIWVDLFSILPYFITLAFKDEESLEILKVVYVLRLYRAFEAFRFSYVLQVFIQTITGSIRELLLLLFICSILVISFGALAYYAEHKANSEGFANIPASFWWSLITMTTVGYGDVSPTTVGGKIVGCACAITGVLLLALPTSIVTTNFSLYNAYAKAKMKLPPRKKTQVVSQALKSVQLRSRDGLRSSMNSPTNFSVLSRNALDVSSNTLNTAGMVNSPRTRRQAISPLAIELDNIEVATRPQINGLNHAARRRSSYS